MKDAKFTLEALTSNTAEQVLLVLGPQSIGSYCSSNSDKWKEDGVYGWKLSSEQGAVEQQGNPRNARDLGLGTRRCTA